MNDETTSLVHLMSICPDFKNEETYLQLIGRKRGVNVDKTTEFHTALADEGIEYVWCSIKSLYCRLPLKNKQGRKNVLESLKKCTHKEQTTKACVCGFAAQSRAHLVAYKILLLVEEECTVHEVAGGLCDINGSEATMQKMEGA